MIKSEFTFIQMQSKGTFADAPELVEPPSPACPRPAVRHEYPLDQHRSDLRPDAANARTLTANHSSN